jgi:hypothetical protein
MASFKDFVLNFEHLALPAHARAVASTAGFGTPPISLRKVMDIGAPYRPDVSTYPFADYSGNTNPNPTVDFYWMDPANYPPWITDSDNYAGPADPNQARQATSWNLKVWEASSWAPPGGPYPPVINVNVPFSNEAAGLVAWTYIGDQLNGEYVYQLTAYNDYGSASTGARNVAIPIPGAAPHINVIYLGANNIFRVTGSGFTRGGQVRVIAQAGGGWDAPAQFTANANQSISGNVDCIVACKGAGGGQLSFQATDLGTGTQSNSVNETCH